MIWRTVIFGAALAVLSLINDQLLWLPPLQFGALAISVLLIVVAPRPAWVALVIAGLTAYSVRSLLMVADFAYIDVGCLNGSVVCTGTRPRWYDVDDADYSPGSTGFFLELPVVPALVVAVGVLGWAIRRLSWRTAVAGALYGVAVVVMPFQAPIVLFAAAAAALGPRKDVRYLMGIGILAIALVDPLRPWTLVGTFVAITAALGLGIWALARKDGVNGVVALVSLAAATLTPYLSAGVLLVASAIKRPVWFKLLAGAIGAVAVNEALKPSSTGGRAYLSQVYAPTSVEEYSMWLILAGVLLVGAAVAALYQHRHHVSNDQANG